MSRYQKGKTNVDLTEARDSESQRHQLGHMQVCTSLQTDNHASTPTTQVFTGRMPFLTPNQQCQSTEGSEQIQDSVKYKFLCHIQSWCLSYCHHFVIGLITDKRNMYISLCIVVALVLASGSRCKVNSVSFL